MLYPIRECGRMNIYYIFTQFSEVYFIHLKKKKKLYCKFSEIDILHCCIYFKVFYFFFLLFIIQINHNVHIKEMLNIYSYFNFRYSQYS